jgi:RNA polymerase sigma factor (sigma-70 family)
MNQATVLAQTKEMPLSPEDRESWKAEITETIDRLNEQERLVMALHYHEELTLAEISMVLDLPVSKVKKIRHATLQKILIRKNAEDK